MKHCPSPSNEVERLDSLGRLHILDTESEPEFDSLVRVASLVCEVPIALISLVALDRQWFKANIGLPGVSETERKLAFCAHTILQDDIFEVEDAFEDPRFRDNDLVLKQPCIRFYAGASLTLSDGANVGSICVIDRRPRKLDDRQREVLRHLAHAAVKLLEGRRALIEERRTTALSNAAVSALDDTLSLLKSNELLLNRTGEVAGVGGWKVDLTTQHLEWSKETRRIHGVSPDFVPDLSQAIEFYAPEARNLIQAAVETAMATGTPWDLELPFIRADGERIWVRAVGEAEFESGKPVRLFGALQDITKQRMLVDAMQSENMQRRAAQAALEQARDQAEQANLAKSQFLANMSHEIRTPMNAVLGMLDLLRYTQLSAQQREYADKSRSAASSLLGLLNDILDFSQVEANRIELETAPFAIETLLRDLSTILSSLIGDKDVEVLFSVDPELPEWLTGDVTRLRQVLINLASNALKFTEQGEVIIAISQQEHGDHESEIKFAVSDTGIGIAADKIDRIFEGFTQADASTARRFGGTGLGLTISQRLVSLMGGTLQVESTASVGSCFHFQLTFAKPAKAPLLLPENEVAPSRLRVLIVDDSPSARMILSAIITSFGWVAVTADNGKQALTALDESARAKLLFDVVLLDWRMPEMDGWELAGRIRAHSNAPLMVLMVTAHGRSALAERLESERELLNGFLTKPVTPSMLRDAIVAAEAGHIMTAEPQRAPLRLRRLVGLRVLVIDDNAMNLQVARELLLHEGAEVCVASGGVLGLSMAVEAEPGFDAILLDIQMPEMDGYACAIGMRSNMRLQSTPIIAMTANVMASERDACLAAGMDAHMGKPIDIEIMVDLLQTHCRDTLAHGAVSRVADSTSLTSEPLRCVNLNAFIDLNSALARLGGNHALYLSLAVTFSTEAKAFLEALTELLPSLEIRLASDLLHTFKSAAGIVGAAPLESYCAGFEQELRNNVLPSDISRVLAEIGRLVYASIAELESVTADLVDAVPVAGTKTLTGPAESLPLLDLLDELALLLKGSNMRALAVMKRIESVYGGASMADLSASIARLDFPAARRHCQQLRSEVS